MAKPVGDCQTVSQKAMSWAEHRFSTRSGKPLSTVTATVPDSQLTTFRSIFHLASSTEEMTPPMRISSAVMDRSSSPRPRTRTKSSPQLTSMAVSL